MSDYGVTKNGFNKKTFETILEDMQNRAKSIFGNDVNLSDASPLGKFIKINALEMSYIRKMSEDVYNSVYLDTAEDQALDNLVSFLSLQRKKATSSKGKAVFNGDEGVEIPQGFKIETDSEDPIIFQTTESGVIDSSGSIELSISAVEEGEYTNISANTITVITNPISGLDSVNNPNPTEGGQDRESNFALRERYKKSVSGPGGSTLASIRANVLTVSGVRACNIEENDTFEVDDKGRMPKSFEVIALGGADLDIGEAIFDKKPAGIQSEGDITTEIKDDSNNTQLVNFSRALEVEVFADITLDIDSSLFPENGNELVKDKLIEYIGGTNSNNDTLLGLSLGENIVYNKVIDAVMSVAGVVDCTVAIGKSDNPTGTANITIANNEVASTSIDNINIS